GPSRCKSTRNGLPRGGKNMPQAGSPANAQTAPTPAGWQDLSNAVAQSGKAAEKSSAPFRGLGEAVKATGGFATSALTSLRRMAEGGADLLRRPLAGLDVAIGAINANITRFVALANPGAVIQFQRAVNDLYAVIGQAMLPALQAMTRFLRDIG